MKTEKVIIIGHKNPDADSILCAIVVDFYSKAVFGCQAQAKRAGEINNETRFILSSLPKSAKIKLPQLLKKIGREKIILVDTTEPNQIISGLNKDNLLAIIDHHNLGGLKSNGQVYARIEPLGCSCSVFYKILKEKKVKPNKNMATLMIAAIISDTLFFNSPTTTSEDKKIVQELNRIAKLDLKKLAQGMFTAKSSLKGIKSEGIIGNDYKLFKMGKNNVGIGGWETTNLTSIVQKKLEILKALKNKKSKEKLNYLFFGAVDIIKQNTELYLLGDEEKKLARQVFKGDIKDDIMFLKGVVSRKKQLVPPLMKKLT